MSNEDAKLCFARHATSKIKTENDLYFINTLGDNCQIVCVDTNK